MCVLRQNRTFFFVPVLFYDSGVLKMEGKGKAKRKNNAPTSRHACVAWGLEATAFLDILMVT